MILFSMEIPSEKNLLKTLSNLLKSCSEIGEEEKSLFYL
jgi:hypothetical protein